MGVTIHYRGRLADMTRIEDFEDRLLDFALEVGGLAQIWRSFDDDNPQRVVRGVILHLAPGQESVSLLVSPEGWLINLTEIEDAERGRLTEPSWCFTKTQFGPLEGHVALVEMFAALGREFLPDLEVSDEGGYWETRDLAELARRHGLVKEASDRLAAGLERHGLSHEAAEDPAILLRRIERVAAQVHRILQRPAEHPPVTCSDDEGFGLPDPDATEAHWDELFKHNRRQQERLQRAIEERRSRGEDIETAYAKAMEDLGLGDFEEEDEPIDEPCLDDQQELFSGSLDAAATADDVNSGERDTDDPFGDDERHPLLESAMNLLAQLHTIFRDSDTRYDAALRTLFQGMGDAMGGLAQALSRPDHEDDDDLVEYGLRVTQLKRALRGAAFARGALGLVRPAVTDGQFEALRDRLRQLEQDIVHELSRLRAAHRPGDGQ